MLAKTKRRRPNAKIPTKVEKNEKPEIKKDKGRIKKIQKDHPITPIGCQRKNEYKKELKAIRNLKHEEQKRHALNEGKEEAQP